GEDAAARRKIRLTPGTSLPPRRRKPSLFPIRQKKRVPFSRPSPGAPVPRFHAGGRRADHGLESRVLRLRNAPAVRDRKAARAIRIALDGLAPSPRRKRPALAPALPLLDDARRATTRRNASVARAVHRSARSVRARAFGRRARLRRE